MTRQELQEILSSYFTLKSAQVAHARATTRDQLETFTIDLATAVTQYQKTYRIDKPFKAISFEDGTDQDAYVKVQFDSQNDGKSFKKFKQNAGLTCETMFDGCTIFFPAQAGKTISCTIYYDCTYESGAQLLSGTIAVARPSAYTITNPALTGGTAALVLAADSTREKVTIQNKTGASVWIGASTVTNAGATTGYELIDGAQYEIENTFAVYVYSVLARAAGLLTIVSET